MLTIEERIKNADERTRAIEHQRRLAQKQANDSKRQQKNRLKYILGDLLLKYFPELSEIVPGNAQVETQMQFQYIEAVMAALADKRELIDQLREEAARSADV